MSNSSNPYYVAYLREKRARNEIEQLLEDSTRQLYEKNLLLQQQIEQIQQQQQSVIQQEKLATLGTLAAGVAHEVNNPLAFIVSNLETLNNYSQQLLQALTKDETLFNQPQIQLIKDDLPELFGETRTGLIRIKDIVHSLLFFSRTDTNAVSAVDLKQAVEFSIKLLQPMLQQVSLTLDFQPISTIQFVSNELNQLLLNILINAAQACEVVNTRPSAITIRLYPTDNHTVLQISDNGCGMSLQTVGKMFDAFYTTKPVGTGVGMSIVLQILKKHHCTIKVSSELDAGTQITIQFPLLQG